MKNLVFVILFICFFTSSSIGEVLNLDDFKDVSQKAYAQQRISVTDCKKNMMEFRHDLLDLCKLSSGTDLTYALNLGDVISLNIERMNALQDFLRIVNLAQDSNNITRIKNIVTFRIQHLSEKIELSLENINLQMSKIKNNAILLIGDKTKTELRKLQAHLPQQ